MCASPGLFVTSAFLLLFALNLPTRAAGSPLQSPWDSHPVSLTDAPFTCVAPPPLPRDLQIGGYYTDSHNSVINPEQKDEHDRIQKPITDFGRELAKAADNYRSTGSRTAAKCVIGLLEGAARLGVLTGKMMSSQAYYEQGWALSSWSIAYLKVRGSGLASPEQTKRITSWFKDLAEDNRDYYESKRGNPHSDAHNNHLYWAGLAISAAGVACDHRKLFNWGMDAYKEGVSKITAEGTLPAEMERASRALHYHLYALGPLIILAEFGEANGLDLYAEKNYAIKRLVARCVSGLQDPSYFVEHTGKPQDMPETIEGEEIGWAKPYARRFPDPEISALLEKARWLNYTTWGGLPPD